MNFFSFHSAAWTLVGGWLPARMRLPAPVRQSDPA